MANLPLTGSTIFPDDPSAGLGGFESLPGDFWGGIDPTTGLPYRTDQGVPQPDPTGAGDPTTGGGWPLTGGTIFPGDPSAGLPGGPLIGSIDPSGGTSGNFDLDTVEGLDQAIAQLQSQIDASMGGTVPDYSAFFKSPGYQFRQDEGIRAIDRSAAARGMLMSGGTLRELQRYGQGLASSEFGNYANRLSSLAGIGQGAAFDTGRLGSAAGAQVGAGASSLGATIMAGGTAAGAGIVNANNAWQQGIAGAAGQFGSAVQQFGAGQGWWGGYDPNTGITWDTGRF